MPLKLPNLDDRTYDDLVKEGLALIQSSSTHWTNHNPSDPGIALVEVFAYLTEMLLYRLNKISDENQRAFIRLLRGPNEKTEEGKSLDEEILDTIRDLRKPWRAVTQSDYERLALEFDPTSFEEYYDKIAEELKWNDEKYKKYKDDYFQLKVRRAHCIQFKESLEDSHNEKNRNQINLVVIKDDSESEIYGSKLKIDDSESDSSAMFLMAIKLYLDPRRLLTTRLRVLEPEYVKLKFDIELKIFQDASAKSVEDRAKNTILDWFDPFKGGQDRSGLPLGACIYRSTVSAILDRVPGVDWVSKVDMEVLEPDLIEVERNLSLSPNELPIVQRKNIGITVL